MAQEVAANCLGSRELRNPWHIGVSRAILATNLAFGHEPSCLVETGRLA